MHQPTEVSNLLRVLIRQTESTLAALKSLDHYTSLDASFETEAARAAKLGDILAAPEKFEHLGKREGSEALVEVQS